MILSNGTPRNFDMPSFNTFEIEAVKKSLMIFLVNTRSMLCIVWNAPWFILCWQKISAAVSTDIPV